MWVQSCINWGLCRDEVHVRSFRNCYFWTPGLPEGVLSNCPCLLVRPSVGPSLDILETALRIFLIFCTKLVHHKGTKVTEPDFGEKNLGGHKWEKNHLGGIFDVFCSYLCIQLSKVSEILYTL